MTDFAKLILDADTTGLKKGEKALKDIGKQSKDTAGDVDSSSYKMGEALGKVAKMGYLALGAAATAAAGALFLAGRRAINTADEMAKTSQAIGVNVEQFQRLSYAVKTVGFDSQKLGDVLKDTTDKLGDFMATGGGELREFFENIAPKVGITADAFRGLNGADALQLYVSSLEKAGVNSQEMTFYLEAIANDASRLAPLLADNGFKMKAFGDEAERFGIIMDERTILSAQEFNVNMMRMGGIVDGLTMRVTAELLPGLISLQNMFIQNQSAIVGVARSFGTLIGYVERAAQAYKRLKLEQGLYEAKTSQMGLFRSQEAIEKGRRDELLYRQAIKDMDQPKRGPREGAFGTSGINALTQQSELARQNVVGLGMGASSAGAALGRGLGGGARAANDNIRPLQGTIESASDTLRKFKQEMQASGLFSSMATQGDITRKIRADTGPVDQDMAKINRGLDEAMEKQKEYEETAARTAAGVGQSMGEMATDALYSLDRLAVGLQSGNFLSILSGVLNFGTQLGRLGVFGEGIKTNLAATPRANGGNVSAGQSYLVGENRPEMFIPDTNGRIDPKPSGGGGSVVVINNSALAEAYVDGRIQTASPFIADAGASLAQSRMGRSASRRVA